MTVLPLYLDISRLLSRAGLAVPTGIDRVEYEYVAYALRHWQGPLEFVAYHPVRREIRVINKADALSFITQTANLWNGHKATVTSLRWMARRILGTATFGQKSAPTSLPAQPAIYLLLSHHHLLQPDAIERFLQQTGARMTAMLHDIIPIEYPEYNRPGEYDRHCRRVATVARLAGGVIVPSEAVAVALRPLLPASLPIKVIAHGMHIWGAAKDATSPIGADILPTLSQDPYFLCIGTIEPRKNHLLLLNIWRDLSHKYGARTPRLIIIGRRGWENENILDMLDRCPALQDTVMECNTLDDRQVIHLLRHTRALLFPSFSEGFGLPLLEALAVDTPSVCSDLAVFREVGGTAAEYLNPLDGPGWMTAIEKLAFASSRQTLSKLRPAATHPPVYEWPHQAKLGIDFAQTVC